MAEVLSPFTTSNNPLALRQSRTTSSEAYQPGTSNQPTHKPSIIMSMPRTHYNSGVTGYRGTSAAPISPYAFKATPQLRSPTASGNAVQPLAPANASASNRQRYPAPSSISTTSSTSSSNLSAWSPQYIMKDDPSLKAKYQIPPIIAQSDLMADLNLASLDTAPEPPAKPSPDRYRRAQRRSDPNVPTIKTLQSSPIADLAATQAFNTAQVGQFYQTAQQVNLASLRNSNASPRIEPLAVQPLAENKRVVESEAEHPMRQYASDTAKRYRQRNSGASQDNGTIKLVPSAPASLRGAPAPYANPVSSTQSGTRQQSFSAHESRPSLHQRTSSSVSRSDQTQQQPRSATPTDMNRRANPSPLSRPPAGNEQPTSPTKSAGERQSFQLSPAVAAMTAINEKDKGMKSRLRRAFSFGSTAELRRASTIETDPALDRARMKREQFSNGLDDEQDAVAQKQEASGLGQNIYSGQGMFTGSTDNLSISSTASSASLMLRKMGQNMRKGSRSIKGIFRPKSVVGAPSADAASVSSVTLVNVEAERELVNVTSNPHDQPGGGTAMPKLENNSIDMAATGHHASISTANQVDGESEAGRRNIVGNDQERAEVLASVRRGILKRSVTSSPISSPATRPVDLALPQRPGNSFERASSPSPSSPRRTGHRRQDSSSSRNQDDYFSNPPRPGAAQSTRSLPGTPRGLSRNISFSPRIQCHETWASGEYDRRGDVATCNRLTPLLAQQIKEELNTFKMEMEVHELSKPHTHFF